MRKTKYIYRELNIDDLEKITTKRHNFVKCEGQIFIMQNTRQALIITNQKLAEIIKPKLIKRKAYLIAELLKNNKVYLLAKCENTASIKALCIRKGLSAPRKIKKLIGLNDILIS